MSTIKQLNYEYNRIHFKTCKLQGISYVQNRRFYLIKANDQITRQFQ